MRAGLAAEFVDLRELRAAIESLRRDGYRELDAFTPHPSVEIEDSLGLRRSRIDWLVFPFAMGGALGGFALQAWCNAYDYALDVGGRPPLAWPTNIPITFETGVLVAATTAFVALFALLGLPRLAHPLFAVDGFERASLDRFWLAVDRQDGRFDRARTTDALLTLGALRVAPFGAEP